MVSRPTSYNFAQVFSTQIGQRDRGGKLCSGNQVADPPKSNIQPIFSIRGFYPNLGKFWVICDISIMGKHEPNRYRSDSVLVKPNRTPQSWRKNRPASRRIKYELLLPKIYPNLGNHTENGGQRVFKKSFG